MKRRLPMTNDVRDIYTWPNANGSSTLGPMEIAE